MTLLWLKIFALQLIWFGGVGIYASSRYQTLFPVSLSKAIAWPTILFVCITATFLLSPLYHWLAAFFMTLTIIMLAWIGLVLASPHMPSKKTVLMSGSSLMFLVALIGRTHVG